MKSRFAPRLVVIGLMAVLALTAVAGGLGQIIASCMGISDVANVATIFSYDPVSGDYWPTNGLPRNDEIWHNDRIINLSPDRSQVMWIEIIWRRPEFGASNGERTIIDAESVELRFFLSDIATMNLSPFRATVIELQQPGYEGAQRGVWLTQDVVLFIDEDREVEPPIRRLEIDDLYGGSRQPLGEYKRVSLDNGVISPNGKYFVFLAYRDDPDEEFWDEGLIVLLDIEKRSVEEIPFYMFGNKVSWHPESSQYVIPGRERDLEARTYWGTAYIFDMATQEISYLRDRVTPLWSPSGDVLAGHRHWDPKDAFLLQPDGSGYTVLDISATWNQMGAQEVSWSGDGQWLFIITGKSIGPETYHLLYYDLESDEVKPILDFPDERFYSGTRLTPSPDGTWVLLEASDGDLYTGLTRTHYVCHREACVEFAPPDTHRCDIVEWAGPYPTDVPTSPVTQ